jgi:hypothetical protein
MKQKKKKTAAEFMAEMERDPAFRAQRQEREAAFRRRNEELRQAEAPLVQALAEVGLDVKSVWDLVNRATRHYPEAVPLLLGHLQRPYPDAIREGIARALTVAEARPHSDAAVSGGAWPANQGRPCCCDSWDRNGRGHRGRDRTGKGQEAWHKSRFAAVCAGEIEEPTGAASSDGTGHRPRTAEADPTHLQAQEAIEELISSSGLLDQGNYAGELDQVRRE